MSESKSVYTHLILHTLIENPADELSGLANAIIGGRFNKVLASKAFQTSLFQSERIPNIIDNFHFGDVSHSLGVLIEAIQKDLVVALGGSEQLASDHLLLLAITLLQAFIQLNFTGPALELNIGILDKLNSHNKSFVTALSSLGQLAYDLTDSPFLLAFSLKIFEILNHSTVSFLNHGTLIEDTEKFVTNSNIKTTLDNQIDEFLAAVQWWRSRAYQVQISLLPESSAVLTSVSTLLLNPSVLTTLTHNTAPEISKNLLLTYYLETARNGLNTNTENLSITALARAKKVSGLNLILTGCKAKRTKFQEVAHASLIILASNENTKEEDVQEKVEQGPESFELNSDVLLERPHYESIGEEVETLLEESNSKRIKLDYSNSAIGEEEDQDLKLLPIALRDDTIPADLKQLDPNNQPRLSDLDMAQLLLRFIAVKQTSPFNSPLVEEELVALIQRILFSPDGSVNWSIFSKALWERSLLETNQAKTVERGVLQMQSLVEELGMSSLKSRLFAELEEKNVDEFDDKPLTSFKRLKLIHQLPLTPRWAMDASLAEKYMSLGVLRSALEIYERLEMWNEAALCYAAVGSEDEALQILERRLSENPNDARTLSILGDIKQDPSYWLKSWEIGKYSKAKNSLARYYYSPPKSSGLARDLAKAIEHQYDSLTINPLAYESWFFYGCLGLEAANYELAAEAFTRCVSMDDTNAHAWSNLSSALASLDKLKPALNALQKAVRVGKEARSWRIWENYLIVAAKLRQWDDVLLASRQLLAITKESDGEGALDIPIVEKLVEILLSSDYDEEHLNHFQKSCIEYVCVLIPQVINTNARCWRIISRVEIWRCKPWAALDCLEKAYRASVNNPELEVSQLVWEEAVDACVDLVAAYENYGDLPGKYGAGDVVCKDWKYKAKTSVRSLLSKGKNSWVDTEAYERLLSLKEELLS